MVFRGRWRSGIWIGALAIVLAVASARGQGKDDLKEVPVGLVLDRVVFRDHYFRGTPFADAVMQVQKRLNAYCDRKKIVRGKIVAPADGPKISFGGSAQSARMKLNMIAGDARFDIVLREDERAIHLYDPRKLPNPLVERR